LINSFTLKELFEEIINTIFVILKIDFFKANQIYQEETHKKIDLLASLEKKLSTEKNLAVIGRLID